MDDDEATNASKPELIQLQGGPNLSQQHVIDLCRKLFGRDLTEQEIADIRETLPMLPEQ